MSSMKELIRTKENGTISFGNYELPKKEKLDNFEFSGDLYKIKTYKEITKLERNGLFVYESVPGTAVEDFAETESGAEFEVEGSEDAQITLGLEADTEYRVFVDDIDVGTMATNLGGKLSLSVELGNAAKVKVRVEKC